MNQTTPQTKNTPWQTNAPTNAYELATSEYATLRPNYPPESILAALNGPNPNTSQTPNNYHHLTVADIGAGTGKLSGQLTALVKHLTCIEPAANMRQQCHQHLTALQKTHTPNNQPNWTIQAGTAENTGLPDHSQNILTYAQCWHWFNPIQATREATRILKPGGHIAIIYNQLDTTIPWVQRLSRIMRSGDIHHKNKPPRMTTLQHNPKTGYPTAETVNPFTQFTLHETKFTTPITPEQLQGLGRTRSSYLKSTPQNQAKMQENLRWYLYEHLGYQPNETIQLPYTTLTWTAKQR